VGSTEAGSQPASQPVMELRYPGICMVLWYYTPITMTLRLRGDRATRRTALWQQDLERPGELPWGLGPWLRRLSLSLSLFPPTYPLVD
jgi:hypothetical protein